MSDWKQTHANSAKKALDHDLVNDVIDEQMGNLGTDSKLVEYGLRKIAMYAASVARAQALGFELNPEYAELCARRLQQLSLLAEPA